MKETKSGDALIYSVVVVVVCVLSQLFLLARALSGPLVRLYFEAVFGFGKIEEKLVKNEQIVVEFVCMSRQPWLQPDMSPSGS